MTLMEITLQRRRGRGRGRRRRRRRGRDASVSHYYEDDDPRVAAPHIIAAYLLRVQPHARHQAWGSEIPAPDRRQATQRSVFDGKFINGKRVIGTYADKKSMTLHTLDQPSTGICSNGRPYVAWGPGEDERENTGHLDISLRLMSFPEEIFARIEEVHVPLHQPGLSL